MLAGVHPRGESGVDHALPQHGGATGQSVDPVDDIDDQMEAVQIVEHHHVEGCRRGAAFLEAAHVQVLVIGAAIGEPVDQPRIAVVGEDDGPVAGEERVELAVRQAMRVFRIRLQPHQVDDVDHPDGQLRQFGAQDVGGGQGLQRRDVPGAGQHHVGFAGSRARPLPDAQAAGAVRDRFVHVEIRQRGLLAGDDDVDVVAAAQTVIGHREQRVAVRRQVHPGQLGSLVGDEIDEARVLMRRAVVVLAPHMRAQQVVQRRDRPPPRQFPARRKPFRVLVQHRVHDVHKRFVAVEQAVPSGQQVAFQPALAQVLRQHLHHAAVGCQVLVVGLDLGKPHLVGRSVDGVEPIGGRFVGTHEPESVPVAGDHVAQERAQHPRGLVRDGRRPRHRHGIVAKVGQVEVVQQQPAVGVRVGAHPAITGGRQRSQFRTQPAVFVEQLLGPIAAQPFFELGPVFGIVVRLGERDLVRAPGALNLLAVHRLWPGPALGCAQHDHRPHWPLRLMTATRRALDGRDVVEGVVEGGGQLLVHGGRVVTGDRDRAVTVTAQQRFQFGVRDAGQHRRVGDLVAVERQDGQHRAVGHRVEELVGVPAGRQRPGFGLAVTDHAGHHQIRVVQGGAVGVHEGVAELTALVDGSRRLGRDVAGNAAGEGELPEQFAQAFGVLLDAGVHLAVGAFEIGVGDQPGTTVTRPGHVDDVGVAVADDPVQVGVDEIESGGGAPMPQQSRFDVVGGQRLGEQRIIQQVDLPDRQVIGGTPVLVDEGEFVVGERRSSGRGDSGF